MSTPMQPACPHCHAVNRLPADRRADGGKCGRCKQLLFSAHPVALDAQNFDANFAQRFGIRSIPTLVLFRDGREVARVSGAMDGNSLLRWVQGQPG